MEKKGKMIVISLIFIFIVASISIFYLYPKNIYSSSSSSILGKTEYGNVLKEGPYGNSSSPIKIAYIIGVHPLESDAHQAILESIKNNDKSLKYSYYIYRINVTKDAGDYEKGRLNGQLLANKFAVPDIENQKFQLVVDIHSNVGNWQEKRFVFSPVKGSKAELIARNIKNNIPWLKYYIPPNPTSTSYVTIPLIEAGIPSILYETYHYDTYEMTKNHANEFVLTVDNLKF